MRQLPVLICFLAAAFIQAGSCFAQQVSLAGNKIFSLDVFRNEEEKSIFKDIAEGRTVDFFQLFLVSGGSSTDVEKTFQAKLDAFVMKTASARKQELKSKELKKMYKDIHDAFLIRYIENPAFGLLFENGNYNCATATALYALLLDRMSISYRIQETPQHVYLVAAPETHHVVFETTLPGTKALQIIERDKTKFLEYLYKNKMIGAEEWKSTDRNALFEKYFYTEGSISKQQLAGLLYYNQGVAAVGNEDYQEAYRNFEKAWFLYPVEKLKYYVSYTLANLIIKDGSMDDEKAYPVFLRFAEVADEELGNGALLAYMEKITHKILLRKPDLKQYQKIYREVISRITDSATQQDLRYLHYYNTAHYFSIKASYDSALVYLDSVYALNQEDLMVQELINNTILERLQSVTEEAVAMKLLKSSFTRYGFIDRNGKLGEYYNFCLSQTTAKCFQQNNKAEADRHLEEIKNRISTDPELSKKSELYFVNAFVEGYYYYVRIKDYKNARAFILSADKIYPGNEEIKKRVIGIEQILQFH